MRNQSVKDFLVEYNELLSKAALEHKGKFAALASPTLNKQETVTFLYEEVIKYINSPNDLVKKEKAFILYLKFIARLGVLLVHLLRDSMRFRIHSLPKGCLYIRTWLVPRSFKNGMVQDDYFRRLIYDLQKSQNIVVGFQSLGYGRLLNEFLKAKKPPNYVIPLGLLSPVDILGIFCKYITTAKLQLKNDYLFKGKNINEIINNSINSDYYKLRSFQAYLELSIAKKLKKYKPKIFLYMFENQAWENAYLSVFKDAEIKTIGYQSSGFSFRFLNFFPTNLDSKISLFPDKLLTVGDLYTKILKDYAHYPIPIQTFAALRFDYPSNNSKYLIEEPVKVIHNRILYAFAVHRYQYEKIINDLVDVFGDTDIEVYLKFHPLYNDKAINVKLPKNFKTIKSIQMKLLRDTYDLVLFNDSSFGVEALMEGVKSFEYEIDSIYDETRMFQFNLYINKLEKNDLILIKESILNRTIKKKFSVKKAKDYINNYYKVYVDPELILAT